MESHNVLIIGSGGRENALAWKISQSKFCSKLFAVVCLSQKVELR